MRLCDQCHKRHGVLTKIELKTYNSCNAILNNDIVHAHIDLCRKCQKKIEDRFIKQIQKIDYLKKRKVS